MRRLGWGVFYLTVFALAFIGGALSTTWFAPSFAGIEDVDRDESMGAIETDLPYGDGALNTFDLYLRADQERATKLVLYIHAGGFTGGDKADDENIAQHFAAQGYAAATINYSLRSDENSVSVLEMSQEIDQGVDAIVEAATERGYDLDGMVGAGGSAGGTLAMIYGYHDAEGSPMPVETVTNFVGLASSEPADWFGREEDYASVEAAEAGAGFVSIITGREITPEMMRSGEYREALEPVTAEMLVGEDSPPTLLAFGELDKVATYAGSDDMERILTEHGVPHDVLVFLDSGHALNRYPEMSERLARTMDEYLETYAPPG